jgi:hypothetical protein
MQRHTTQQDGRHGLTRLRFQTTVWGIGVLTLACARLPPPQAAYTQSEVAVRLADTLGAQHVPAAALHLHLARQSLEQASHLMQNGDNHRATYVLMRAEADAELAQALAREAPARAVAHDALDKVQSLRQEKAF